MAFVQSANPDFSSEEILKRAAASRAATPTAIPGAGAPPPNAAAPAATPPTAGTPPTGIMGKLRSAGGTAISLLGRAGGAIQSIGAGADMAKNGVTPSNATSLAAGGLTMAAPQFGVPLNAGMAVGGTAMDAVTKHIEDTPYSVGDIRGPETIAYQAREAAKKAPAAAVTPDVAGGNGGWNEDIDGSKAREHAQQMERASGLFTPNLAKPLAPQAGVQPIAPPMINPPAQKALGPLPTLQANPDQSIFSALLNLGKDNAAYRNTAIANKQGQTDFGNMLKAGNFNIDAISKMTQVKTALDENERKDFDTQLKARSAEALRVLATGKFDKTQEQGLRLLAGLGKGTYRPAVIYGEEDANGVQQKMTVAVSDDGRVIPLQVPGFSTPDKKAKTMTKADFDAFVKKNGYSDKQARAYVEKQGYKVGS